MILGLVISRGFEEYKVFKKILFETKHYDELEKMKLKEDEKIKWLGKLYRISVIYCVCKKFNQNMVHIKMYIFTKNKTITTLYT